MIEAAAVRPGNTVLEVGAGSGYAAAVMGEIADRVHTMERHAPLGETAKDRLAKAGCLNVALHVGDGTLGWPEAAPYAAIIVAAGGPLGATGAEGATEGGRAARDPGGGRTKASRRS